MTAVLEAAERTGTTIEINAHSSDGLDMIHFGIMVARRGWLEKEDVVNAQEADTLQFKQ